MHMTDEKPPAEPDELEVQWMQQFDRLSQPELAKRRMLLGRQITDTQRKWAEAYVSVARFNASKAARIAGCHHRTGYIWRDSLPIRRYCAALVAESAAKLALTRDAVLEQIGRIAMSDIGEIMAAMQEAANAAAEAALQRDLDGEGVDTPEGEDGHQRRSHWRSGHWLSGPDLIQQMGPTATMPIRKVKFKVEMAEEWGWVEDPETGKSEWRKKTTTPVAVLDHVEMHDKLAALSMLAPWFGLREGALSNDDGDDRPWRLEVVPPPDDDDGG